MSLVRRAGALLLLTPLVAAATLPLTAAPAWAHAGGLSPSAVRSTLLAVTPEVPGLAVSVIEDGARIVVRNDTGATVEVPAGDGQPVATTVPPATSTTWIDARATTLGRDLDGAAQAGWTVPMTVGTTPVRVVGGFTAVPPPVAGLWWALAAVVAVGTFLLIRWAREPHLPLAVAGLAIVAAAAVHVIGATLAVESAPLPGVLLDATGIGLLVWPVTALAAVSALRGRSEGVLGVCVGAALGVVFVLPDLTVFHFGALPFAGPPTLERALVAVVLGGGIGVTVAGARVLRQLAEHPLAERPSSLPTNQEVVR